MLPVVSTPADSVGIEKVRRRTHPDRLPPRQAVDSDLTKDSRLANSSGAAEEGDGAGLFGSIGELRHGGFLRPCELQGCDG